MYKDGTKVQMITGTKGIIDNGTDERKNNDYHWIKTDKGYFQVYKDDFKIIN